jgi:acyl dehydratase
MAARTLQRSPRILPLYARAAAATVLRRGAGDIPTGLALELPDVAVDRHHLAAYTKVCGFRLRDELPATYLHVVAFPLHLALMSDGRFPFGAVGLIHVANRIEQHRPIGAGERLDLRVWADGLAPHERGRQFELHGEASMCGEVVWRDRSTYLHREGGGSSSKRDGGEPPPASAIWDVPGDIGRRYARVSGDANPIHMHPLIARALGQPGAIAHGMWTKARCLAGLEGELPEAYAVDVRFKLPLRVPGRAAFSYRDGEFEVHDARGRPHLSGRVTPPTGG